MVSESSSGETSHERDKVMDKDDKESFKGTDRDLFNFNSSSDAQTCHVL